MISFLSLKPLQWEVPFNRKFSSRKVSSTGSGGMLTSPLARIHSPRRIPNPPRAVRMTFYLLSCHQRGRRAPRQAPRSLARPRSSQCPLPVPPSVSPPPPAPIRTGGPWRRGAADCRPLGARAVSKASQRPSDSSPGSRATAMRVEQLRPHPPPGPHRLRASLPAGAFRDRMYLDQKEQSAFFRPRRLGSRELNSL